ncbi:hypothetical protein FB45DRAFT_999590 [Roridomyces roridus]|uniref:Uncharacterized protein n=1 Tax=Roridomyces roridus TaxID=1738132 RepID=A0AAD7CCH7_9AGAR|nr:hypothetical protein FB45DRAFT_999590 [Roridomyces roridus]
MRGRGEPRLPSCQRNGTVIGCLTRWTVVPFRVGQAKVKVLPPATLGGDENPSRRKRYMFMVSGQMTKRQPNGDRMPQQLPERESIPTPTLASPTKVRPHSGGKTADKTELKNKFLRLGMGKTTTLRHGLALAARDSYWVHPRPAHVSPTFPCSPFAARRHPDHQILNFTTA